MGEHVENGPSAASICGGLPRIISVTMGGHRRRGATSCSITLPPRIRHERSSFHRGLSLVYILFLRKDLEPESERTTIAFPRRTRRLLVNYDAPNPIPAAIVSYRA